MVKWRINKSNKTNEIRLRCTEEEKLKLKDIADSVNMKMSELIRYCIDVTSKMNELITMLEEKQKKESINKNYKEILEIFKLLQDDIESKEILSFIEKNIQKKNDEIDLEIEDQEKINLFKELEDIPDIFEELDFSVDK